MTGRERRLLRMLCMTAGSGGGGGDKPWEEMTWNDVIAATKNGKYKNFEIGAMKELDLGSEGIVHMQIVGIDVDELADGSGYAPLTFISKELLDTNHRMNPALTPSAAPYDEGTGTIGGWEKCEMRTYLKETVKPLIPENVRNAIVDVTKYSRTCDATGTVVNDVASVNDVWIPSKYETVGAATNAETQGARYGDVFSSFDTRKKNKVGVSSADYWWLRTAGDNTNFLVIAGNGAIMGGSVMSRLSIALGFCL